MSASSDADVARFAITGARLALPRSVVADRALVISSGRIEAVADASDLDADIPALPADGMIIAPGFIDLQVNGGGGVLFNDQPTADGIEAIFAAHRTFGTTGFLPTLISTDTETMHRAIDTVIGARSPARPWLLGLHLEGPYLAAERKGIHNDRHFRAPDASFLDRLDPQRVGAIMMTLAPEIVPAGTIAALSARGIRVAAGHTAASYEATRDALTAGVTGFTHLFNAMPPMLSRAPGAVAAALESDAWCTLIADGHHVDAAMLRLVMRAKTDGRLIFVTDAMPPVGTEQKRFVLDGEIIRREPDGRLTGPDGTLAGSSLTMIEAVRFGTRALGLPLERAVAMATSEPASFLGIAEERGVLATGRRADLVFMSEDLDIHATLLAEDCQSLRSVRRLLQLS